MYSRAHSPTSSDYACFYTCPRASMAPREGKRGISATLVMIWEVFSESHWCFLEDISHRHYPNLSCFNSLCIVLIRWKCGYYCKTWSVHSMREHTEVIWAILAGKKPKCKYVGKHIWGMSPWKHVLSSQKNNVAESSELIVEHTKELPKEWAVDRLFKAQPLREYTSLKVYF